MNQNISSLGDLFEGNLYQTANGDWVIRDDEGEHSIDDLLKKYSGEEIRLIFVSLNDLDQIRDMIQENQNTQ